MHWLNSRTLPRAPKRPDKQILYVVHYSDGTTAYMRVPPKDASFKSLVSKIALERQSRGELPPGEITNLVRAR